MRRWLIAWSMAILAVGLAPAAHADEWNKLTYFTFSGPVNMPGITLPAGTYRFELADPDSSRRVVRVSDKDGSKSYGIFLSISDQKLEPSDKPLVMFTEMPAGAPQAVRAWFYPGETTGYEFVYPHDQALKIAKATHEPVLTMKDSAQASTDTDRVASMKSAEVTRIDENDKPVSTDERLKDSSALHPSNSAAATTTASSAAATTTAKNRSAATTTAQPTTSEPAGNRQSNAQSTTARADTASSASPANAAQTPRGTTAGNRAVGTSGQTSQPGAATNTAAPRRQLPRTASELPLMELLGGLAFAGGAFVRALRR